MNKTTLAAAIVALAGLKASLQASDVTFIFQARAPPVPLSPWTLAAILPASGAVAFITASPGLFPTPTVHARFL